MSSDRATDPALVIKPIAELFGAGCVALWATTYNLDLALFNEFLLGRLGDPPLNVVVLADRDRLDVTLDAVPPERVDILGPVNRRWLLRGARVGGGRFHPKSYLAVTARTTKLLVGSGNLSTNGIDAGREVFTAFVAGTPHGDAAIRTWQAWMRRLVDAVDDTVLADRFTDLQQRLPRPSGPTPVMDSPLWHNLDRPLTDQLCDTVLARTSTVDELIVTAPYYDETGDALGRLADRLKPRRLTVYLASSTNVDGSRLAARLAGTGAEVETLAYVPDRFTHAKLVGIVAAEKGWLLSGSANLSHAALTLPAGPGNVELAVFADLSADALRHTFLPPKVTAEPRPLTSLAELTFNAGTDEPAPRPVRITRASLLADGRVHVTTEPAPEAGWRLADHETTQPLIPGGPAATTARPLAGPLVHVVDSTNTVLSNHIVIDDLDALRRVLQVGEKNGSGRPPELTTADLDTPLGQALLFLHRNVVMDVSERAGAGGGGDVTRDEVAGKDGDDDLWNRLEREKLGRDPRAGTYARLLGQRLVGGVGVPEPLIELLEAMRDRAPSEGLPDQHASLLQLIARDAADGTGSRWSTTAKVRVRARNVLRRWAAAQTDPRLSWVDPLAPLGNLSMIAAIFGQLWCHNAVPGAVVELTSDDLDDLWARWFRPFVGTGQGDGWLDHADLPDEQIQAHVGGDFSQSITALCWLAIRPGRERRQRVISWQPYLMAAFDKNLIDVGDDTVEFLATAGHAVDRDRVETDLLQALDYIDDALWCHQNAAHLGLSQLALQATSAGQRTSVRLNVNGIEDPLHDPRIPTLLVAVRQYRSTDAVALFGVDHDWRVVRAEAKSADQAVSCEFVVLGRRGGWDGCGRVGSMVVPTPSVEPRATSVDVIFSDGGSGCPAWRACPCRRADRGAGRCA